MLKISLGSMNNPYEVQKQFTLSKCMITFPRMEVGNMPPTLCAIVNQPIFVWSISGYTREGWYILEGVCGYIRGLGIPRGGYKYINKCINTHPPLDILLLECFIIVVISLNVNF